MRTYSALHYRTFKKTHISSRNYKKGHVDRDPDYKWKRQNELEKLGYYLIRDNPDKINFNDYQKFGRVSAYIAESIKKQTEKLLIHDLSKRLPES